ncbi:MAG: enoyl-CoA hydratase/isomerase family protein [Acidimicrobiales bacterium]|nr:enoyl-CoA hydratase/isomerase family protein [Acidimicrobiales bacterium]
MNEDLCLYDVQDGVAVVTLNRPERNNGMNGDLEVAFLTRLLQAADDPAARTIVITGAGKAFCPGADLAGGPGASSEPLPNTKIPVDVARRIAKPLIAAVNGACAGVGLVQALYCDVRFADANAKFTCAFPRRGLIAEYGIAWILPRVAGRGVATDLLVSGRVFTAAEALQYGVVNRVCEPGTVLDEAIAYAKDVALNVAPGSMATIKRQLERYEWMDWDGALADSHALMRHSIGQPDVVEGIGSFVERRTPAFAPLGEGSRYPWMERPGPLGVRPLSPEGLSKAQGFFHAVESAGGRMVSVAGQVARNAAGEVVGAGDLVAQTAQALANVEQALAAAGLTPADVVKLNYYIVDLDPEKAAAFGAGAALAKQNGVSIPRAAATMLGVTALVDPAYLVEIEAVAVR